MKSTIQVQTHTNEDVIAKTPGNMTAARFLAGMLYRRLKSLWYTAFTRIEWNVGITSLAQIDPQTCSAPRNVAWLPKETRKTYLADPFFLRSGDKICLLAETIERADQRGVIVAYEITGKRVASLGVVIESKDAHMSYPFLFRWKGDVYCVPEQGEAGVVVLYRAVEFPKRWERVRNILSAVKAIDSTLFQANSSWWLSYTEGGIESNTRLMLWYANEPTGPWIPHARNPIKIDPRCSRGAGAPFVHKGMLIRPTQDCSRSYGGKIVFNRIIKITPTEYEEEIIGELLPDPESPYPHGLHTISLDGDTVVIDGWTRVFDPMGWFDQIRSRGLARAREARRAANAIPGTDSSAELWSGGVRAPISPHPTSAGNELSADRP